MARKIARPVDPQTRRRAILIGIGAGCGSLVLLGLLVALIGYMKLTAKPPQPAEAKIAQTSQATSAAPLDQQVHDIQRRAATGQPVPFQLDLSSADITASLAPTLQRQGVQDVKVFLGEGVAVAQGQADLDGRKLWTTLRVAPRVQNGKVRFELVDATVGTFPMPAGLREKVQQEIDRAIEKDPTLGSSVLISDIKIASGRMYVQGTTTGRR